MIAVDIKTLSSFLKIKDFKRNSETLKFSETKNIHLRPALKEIFVVKEKKIQDVYSADYDFLNSLRLNY